MNDLVDQAAGKKKSAAKPSRPPEKKGAQASRIGYKERNKIAANNRDPRFHYRVFNFDNEKYSGRLEQALEMGYIYANDGESLGDSGGVEASQIGDSVGRHVGHGTRGVLMKIPKEFYEEDAAAKQAEVDKSEMGMIDEELLSGSGLTGEGLKVDRASGQSLRTTVQTK